MMTPSFDSGFAVFWNCPQQSLAIYCLSLVLLLDIVKINNDHKKIARITRRFAWQMQHHDWSYSIRQEIYGTSNSGSLSACG
jgi:hypothetical protein